MIGQYFAQMVYLLKLVWLQKNMNLWVLCHRILVCATTIPTPYPEIQRCLSNIFPSPEARRCGRNCKGLIRQLEFFFYLMGVFDRNHLVFSAMDDHNWAFVSQ